MHTEGPWKITKCGRKIFKPRSAKWMPDQLIATTAEIFMDRSERESNARLIVSAPEMYELLELTAQKLESQDLQSRQAQRIRQLLSRINSNT